MSEHESRPAAVFSIAAVERDTGLSKDTLRVWERRYGFPNPDRDSFGERAYSTAQVDKLRALRRLIDAGHRPGKIIRLSMEGLRRLSNDVATACAHKHAPTEDLTAYIALLKEHRVFDLRDALSKAVQSYGLARFLVEVAAPLNRMVGEAWARGYLEVFEEHLYTESIKIALRAAIGQIAPTAEEPKILLTTVPNELHGLGLLMAEAMLALQGGVCFSLGTETPLWDIVLAATAQSVDIVALSFSSCISANQVVDGLTELRSKLPAATEIWAGGSSPILRRRPPSGVVVLRDLNEIESQVRRWRATRAALQTEASRLPQPSAA